MNSFEYFIAILSKYKAERVTIFTSPVELNINIYNGNESFKYQWNENLENEEIIFWQEQIYQYSSNDDLWAWGFNICYSTSNKDNIIGYNAYKEILLPTQSLTYSSYFITLDNKNNTQEVEIFPHNLSDYPPLKLYKKLQKNLPNKNFQSSKSKI